MCGLGLWKGRSLFLTSATAVCRLSKELDFFKPRVGPKSLLGESGRKKGERSVLPMLEQCTTVEIHVILRIFLPGKLQKEGVKLVNIVG